MVFLGASSSGRVSRWTGSGQLATWSSWVGVARPWGVVWVSDAVPGQGHRGQEHCRSLRRVGGEGLGPPLFGVHIKGAFLAGL